MGSATVGEPAGAAAELLGRRRARRHCDRRHPSGPDRRARVRSRRALHRAGPRRGPDQGSAAVGVARGWIACGRLARRARRRAAHGARALLADAHRPPRNQQEEACLRPATSSRR